MIAILQSNVKSFARNHKFPLVPHKDFSSIVIFLQQTSEIIAFFLLFFKVFNKCRFNIVNSLFIKGQPFSAVFSIFYQKEDLTGLFFHQIFLYSCFNIFVTNYFTGFWTFSTAVMTASVTAPRKPFSSKTRTA